MAARRPAQTQVEGAEPKHEKHQSKEHGKYRPEYVFEKVAKKEVKPPSAPKRHQEQKAHLTPHIEAGRFVASALRSAMTDFEGTFVDASPAAAPVCEKPAEEPHK